MMKNPNARVAVGKKGKQVVKKLMDAKKSPVADEEAPAPKTEKTEAVSSEIDELIKAAKAKKTKA